jgi:hypothetical protein
MAGRAGLNVIDLHRTSRDLMELILVTKEPAIDLNGLDWQASVIPDTQSLGDHSI